MTTRRIFRESAVRRYNERLERIELPRYATLPWRRLVWASAGLLLLLAGLLLAARLPVYAVGPGIVVHDATADGAKVVALLPAEYAAQLQPGQMVDVTLVADARSPIDGAGATVAAVEPRPLSPAAARARYGLDAATGALIEGPVAVALITFDRPMKLWAGSVADVRVQVGDRSGLALLPGVGRLFASGSGVTEETP